MIELFIGVLTGIEMMIVFAIGFGLFAVSVILAVKNERTAFNKMIWCLFIIFVPLAGSLIYLLKYYLQGNDSLSRS